MFTVMQTTVTPIHNVLPYIVRQVATLTQSTQVYKAVVCSVTVQVRSGQYHYATRDGMGYIINRATVRKLWRSFAAINAICNDRAPLNESNNQRPFWMIFTIVDWHHHLYKLPLNILSMAFRFPFLTPCSWIQKDFMSSQSENPSALANSFS